jgi:hypothetical protein
MRFVVAVMLLAYGAAHVAVLMHAWRAAHAIDLRMRVVAIVWLLTSGAFAGAACGVAWTTGWWPSLTEAAAIVSFVLCLRAWPTFRAGLALDIAIVVAVALGLRGTAGAPDDRGAEETPPACWRRPPSPRGP